MTATEAVSTTAPETVIYASEVQTISGSWTVASDANAAGGHKLTTTDVGFAATNAPLAAPTHHFETTFDAHANTDYRIWIRLAATANSKFNDSIWVQFSGSLSSSGGAIYRIGTTSGLLINLASTDCTSSCSLNGWGWENTAYWLGSQATTVRFASNGPQTIRVQVREDGVQVDQIVISPADFLSAGPGPNAGDATVLSKPLTNIVLYAGDVPNLNGSWQLVSDPSAAGGSRLSTTNTGFATTENPLASPTHHFDVEVRAQANMDYRLWLRLSALDNNKFNDAVWVQFSNVMAGGTQRYQIGTTNGLLVNLATSACTSGCSLNGWGWQNGAYWLTETQQPTTVRFPTTGTHTIRIQVREDGVSLDQIVLSPGNYLNAPPGPVGGDSTIVSKDTVPDDPAPVDVNCAGVPGACTFEIASAGSFVRVVGGLPPSSSLRVSTSKSCALNAHDPAEPYAAFVDGNGQITVDVVATAACTVIVGETIVPVASCANLQTAIDNALPGETLLLAQGATCTGSFSLDAGNTGWVGIRCAGAGATIIGNIPQGGLRTDPTARYWYVENCDFTSSVADGDVIRLGTAAASQDTLEEVPEYIILDGNRITGAEAPNGQRNGIALHTGYAKIINNEITNIKRASQETHGIVGGNGPGPYIIADNLIQAAAINILFGGVDPPIVGLVPSNILVTRNTISKPLEWEDDGFTVKNLIEFKNAINVTVTYNDFDGLWAAPGNSMRGHAVWLKSTDQEVGGSYVCTLCEVRNVYFGYNTFTRIASGPQITAVDGGPATPMTDVVFEHNFFNLDTSAFVGTHSQAGAGRFMATFRGTHGVEFRNNTIINVTPGDAFAVIEGDPNNDFVFINNIWMDIGPYGWHPGDGSQLSTHFPGNTWLGNLYESNGGGYPTVGNVRLSVGGLAAAGYNSTTRLLDDGTPHKGSGVGGVDPGWDGSGGRPQP